MDATPSATVLLVEIEPGGAIPVRGMPGVEVVEAPTLSDVDKLYVRLRAKQDRKEPLPQTIVLDTITYLAETTWQNTFDVRPGVVWESRKEFDNRGQSAYGTSSKTINRVLMQYRQLKANTIFVFHEEEREIPPEMKPILSPAVNPKILNAVLAWSDALVHLGKTDGVLRVGKDMAPRGTRVLLLEGNSTYRAKVRFPLTMQPGPTMLIDPVLTELYHYTGNTGNYKISLYGPPGVGNTTLACGGRPVLARDAVKRMDEFLKGGNSEAVASN